MSGSLRKLIKDFWIMVPNPKALDSHKVKFLEHGSMRQLCSIDIRDIFI